MACASCANASDMFTKQVGNIFFAHHNDNISGCTTFFCINSYLLLVPGHASGARVGGVSVLAGFVRSSRIPAIPFEIHSLE
jgi:hypothetical protein